MTWAIRWGADTVMDLSTGKNIHETREWILRNSPVPIGTVPIYQALEKVDGKAEELTWEIFRDTLIEQAEQGVDYFTIHAGVRLPLHPADREAHDRHRLARRLDHGQVVPRAPPGELPLHALRRDLRDHDGLRRRRSRSATACGPGSIADANDEAQFAELRHAGRADDRSPGSTTCQVMIEGPGHVPMHLIKENMDQQLERLPRGAVLHARAAHHRHRARLRPHHQRDRRGDDRLVRHRDALLRHAQGAPRPAEQEGREGRRHRLQDRRPRRRPRQGPSRRADPRQRAVEGALRVPLGGPVQPRRSIPDTAREFHDETLPQEGAKLAHFCSMCGPHFCSMKITQDVRDYAAKQGVADEPRRSTKGMEEKAEEFVEQGGGDLPQGVSGGHRR